MNNNVRDTRHPAQQPSGPNKFLQLAKLSGAPLAIYFTDGEVIDESLLLEFDTLNLLVTVVKTKQDLVITRATVKKIVTAAEYSYQSKARNQQ